MPVDLKFKTKIVQNNNQGHYAIYIFNDILEDDYLKELLDKTLELTEIDFIIPETGLFSTVLFRLSEYFPILFFSSAFSFFSSDNNLRSRSSTLAIS